MLTGRYYDDEKVSGALMALSSRSFDETIDCNRISIFVDPTEKYGKKISNIHHPFEKPFLLKYAFSLDSRVADLHFVAIVLPLRLEHPQLPLLTTYQARPHAIHSARYF